MAIGAFRAVAKGVVFVTSAGNDGPDPSTVNNDTPWEITVAAGSVDRKLAAGLLAGCCLALLTYVSLAKLYAVYSPVFGAPPPSRATNYTAVL